MKRWQSLQQVTNDMIGEKKGPFCLFYGIAASSCHLIFSSSVKTYHYLISKRTQSQTQYRIALTTPKPKVLKTSTMGQVKGV